MATYTDNYNLIKPTYAETADIVPLNNNFEKIDEVMHASQASLAPAYDQTASYQPGDVVMYELNMYKCTGATSGAWDPSKWTRTTAAETGGGGSVNFDIFGEASGTAEASFSDGAEASLAKCIVEIEATQSGSGTPSPSNIRPISGHTDVTVTVASTSGGSGEDTTVSLGRTVYGGTIDVTTGELTDEDGTLLVFNSGNTNVWSGAATSPQGITRFYTTPSYVGRTLVISDTYKVSSNYATEIGVITMSNDGRIIITPSFGQGKTLDEFKALLADNPFNVLMTLATPQTFTLTPTQVLTLLGQNYVSHDGGGTISLVYVKGDAPIKPNPAGAEIPLTGLEIDGKKFSIPSGERTQNRLWNYMINNGGTIVYDGSIISLSDNITNYDELVVEVVSAQQDLSDNWRGSNQIRINVEALINAINPYNMVICTYDNRSSKLTFTTNTLQKTMGLGDINGIVNVYGIKYNG